MKITFYGAAQNVTGSKHLIQTENFNLLLDCGLYQGKRRETEELNKKLPFEASKIDAVILSHAHADHCGTLPLLVKNGFSGKIYCTGATADIAKYILLDSAEIQKQDCDYLNRHARKYAQAYTSQNLSQNKIPADETPVFKPIFDKNDVYKTLDQFSPVPYFRLSNEWTEINENIKFKFYDAGHILGSAITYLEIKENGITKTLAFTGDLGQAKVPILHEPEKIFEPVETILMECTYGDKRHKPISEAIQELIKVVNYALENNSKIIVPAFSLGRTQELIYILHKLTDEGQIPRIPIYLDSPLAENFTEVFSRHTEDYNRQAWIDFGSKHDLPLFFRNLHYVRSVEESKELQSKEGPLMIISSSGMAEAGRILHHLKNGISNERNIVLITGYQAENTLGRKLQEGQKTVKILGEEYTVKSQIITLDEFSAHADQAGLLDYIGGLKELKNIFLVHTEKPQAEAFKNFVLLKYPNLKIDIPAFMDFAQI